MAGRFKKTLVNIFPELPGITTPPPTPEERKAVLEAIAEGYLHPETCMKMEPRMKTEKKTLTVVRAIELGLEAITAVVVDDDGKAIEKEYNVLVKDVNGQPVPDMVDGKVVTAPMGVVKFNEQQDRILYGISKLTVTEPRKLELRRNMKTFQDGDKNLPVEATLLSVRIGNVMAAEEVPENFAAMVTKVKEVPTHIPVQEFCEKFVKLQTGKTDKIYFKEFSDSFKDARMSAKVARISALLMKTLAQLEDADKDELLADVEAAIPELVEQ